MNPEELKRFIIERYSMVFIAAVDARINSKWMYGQNVKIARCNILNPECIDHFVNDNIKHGIILSHNESNVLYSPVYLFENGTYNIVIDNLDLNKVDEILTPILKFTDEEFNLITLMMNI